MGNPLICVPIDNIATYTGGEISYMYICNENIATYTGGEIS